MAGAPCGTIHGTQSTQHVRINSNKIHPVLRSELGPRARDNLAIGIQGGGSAGQQRGHVPAPPHASAAVCAHEWCRMLGSA